MRNDIDNLMEQMDLAALLVTGPAQHNPAMVYLTGGGHITQADLIIPRGQPAVLFHGPMERDEAARAAAQNGLIPRGYSDYPLNLLLKQARGSRSKALALRYQRILADVGINQGRVMLYGREDAGAAFSVYSALQALMPGLAILSDEGDGLLAQAMATKSPDEIDRIRRMGRMTAAVVAETADFLSGHSSKDGILQQADGQPLRIGDVKRRINRRLAESGAENPEGIIFAIGRDAGVPHSSGNPQDLLRLGQTIVFDFFPCEAEGGYYYDFTRTWCLGHAPDEALALHENVLAVHRTIFAELEVGAYFPKYQERACDIFEAQGHPTIRSHPDTTQGYVHSLGHGIGLKVHEKPWSGSNAAPDDILSPGSVFTIEPGLYYPDRGLGMRLEDSAWVTPEGKFEILATYPLDLIIPITRQA